MDEQRPIPEYMSFDAVEIDSIGHRLLVSGVETALEPKAFAVLVLLVSQPGRVFSRDEILDAVWGHSHITPGVLNRIITMLRQALGESARDGQYLRTVHGIGYRFDGHVQFRYMPVDKMAAPVVERRGVAKPIPIPIPPVIVPAAEEAAVPGTGLPVTVAPRGSRLRWFVVAGVLLALLALWAYWRGHESHHVPVVVTASTQPRSIIVLPLRVISGTPSDTAFADSLGEDFITLLSRVEGLRVIARTSAVLAQHSGEDLPGIAKRLDVGYALEGSVSRQGEQLSASLRLVEIANGRILWAERYDRAVSEVFALERDVAQSVVAALALTLNTGLQAELNRSEDSSLYRRYLEARFLMHSSPPLVVGRQRAQDAFRALVADAPNYARGHSGLALALTQTAYTDLHDAVGKHAEAAAEAERALQLDPTLADAYVVLGDAACRDGDWERGMRLTRQAVDLAPADSLFRIWYARHLLTLGYLSQALDEMKIAQASDPLSLLVNYQMARVLDTLGRHAEAQHYLDTQPEKQQAARWFNAIWRGDLAHASQFIVPADTYWHDSYVAVMRALADPSQWPVARVSIDASERAAGGQSNWLRMLDPQPDIPRDIAMVEGVWRSGYSSLESMLWNPELANHRRDPAFQDYLQRNHMLAYWRAHGWPDRCRPVGDLVTCE